MDLGNEDDLDIIDSEYSFINLDYTIHPQWFLDRPSANPDNWYKPHSTLSSSTDSSETEAFRQISTEDYITDESGWTEKEKNLLKRGLDIFGTSSARLSQFIGSKTAADVKYYLKYFYCGGLGYYKDVPIAELEAPSDIKTSAQIPPASIEQVVTSPSSARASSGKLNTRTKVAQQKKSGTAKGRNLFRNVRPKVRKRPCKTQTINENVVTQEDTSVSDRRDSSDQHLSKPLTAQRLEDPVDEDELSDVNIDVEGDDDEASNISRIAPMVACEREIIGTPPQSPPPKEKIPTREVSDAVAKELDSSEPPAKEAVLDPFRVTDLEKYVHWEFFQGKTAKTPERYLKIRNYILSRWQGSKPTYIFKTAMRAGLKNCGDVKNISRIHYFLEQIGAINFGCGQTKYERPLRKILEQWEEANYKAVKLPKTISPREPTELGPRNRVKKRFINNGEGGCTLIHGDNGEVINTIIVNEEKPVVKATAVRKPTVRLIFCKPLRTQPFAVKIDLATLLLMDFHAHLYPTEVMGLIGGVWCPDGGISIHCYEPCKNQASSTTHCDMCPVSQAIAAESIRSKDYDLLGWFHSHPTFAPEPSQQDLDTQRLVQKSFGYGKPCIGMILTPFSANGALIASPFRCWMVDKKPNFEDQFVPYSYDVCVNADFFVLEDYLQSLKRLLLKEERNSIEKRIKFEAPYFQNSSISHLDKFISSVNMRLVKDGSLDRPKVDEALRKIRETILTTL